MTTAQASAEAARLSKCGKGYAYEAQGTGTEEDDTYCLFSVTVNGKAEFSIISFDECFDKIAQREVTA